MKRIIATTVLAIFAVVGSSGEESVTNNEIKNIRFRFADKEIIVSMVDNSAVRSLIAMLPLTLKFEDYAGSEKISYPPQELDLSEVPAGYDPSVGDLTFYAPWGDLAFFYRDHGYANGLVPLGRIISGSQFLSEIDKTAEVRLDVAD